MSTEHNRANKTCKMMDIYISIVVVVVVVVCKSSYLSPKKPVCRSRKQQLELYME